MIFDPLVSRNEYYFLPPNNEIKKSGVRKLVQLSKKNNF